MWSPSEAYLLWSFPRAAKTNYQTRWLRTKMYSLSAGRPKVRNELHWAQVTVFAVALSLWKLEWRPVPSLLQFPMAANILWLGATSPVSAWESHHLLLFCSQISLCLPLTRTPSVHIEPGLVIQDNFPHFKSLHRKCFLAIERNTHRFQGLKVMTISGVGRGEVLIIQPAIPASRYTGNNIPVSMRWSLQVYSDVTSPKFPVQQTALQLPTSSHLTNCLWSGGNH